MNPARTRFFFSIFSFLFFLLSGNAQSLLNGDFEKNTADGCIYNLENEDFNLIMEDVVAFGSNSEMDIHNDTCGYADVISNNWFVSLSQRPSGEIDQLSLRMDMPLTLGSSYRLTYFDWAETSGLNNIPLPLEIGLSTDSMIFGTLIHTSMPVEYEWTQQSVEFMATEAAQYITIRMAGASGLKGWTFVDGFELSPLTAVAEVGEAEVAIYPNPARDYIFIETDLDLKSIRIINAMGQEVKSFPHLDVFRNKLDLSGLGAGVYFLEIINEKNRVVRKIEKL
ncbi:MAG: T9SS type A sorting domain-containing protein [Saprospiraceae bacterium]